MATHLITDTAIIVHLPGRARPDQVVAGHPNFILIRDAVKKQDWDIVAKLVDVKSAIVQFSGGKVTIIDDEVLWEGAPVNAFVVDKILELMHAGEEITPLVCFLERCLANPEKRAVDELYQFLERGKMPITLDGKFRAFKKVRGDYRDIHSGTFDNTPGNTLEMERSKVDGNKWQLCSTGLHFCSREYLGNFGSHDGSSRIVEVEIDPADVVAIPADYNNTKGRTAKYLVIADVGIYNEDADSYFRGPIASSYSDDDDDEDAEDFFDSEEEDEPDEFEYRVEFIALTHDGDVAEAATNVEATDETDARAKAKALDARDLDWDEPMENIDFATARVSEVWED